MLTRRTFTTSLAALCANASHMGLADAAGPMPQTPVAFDVPHGACDSHVHVIGDPSRFPMSPQRDYTPPVATADDLGQMLEFLRLDRVVIVTPTIYNEDNSATLAAVAALGLDRARGVAMIDETAPAGSLDALREGGVAGFRLLMSGAAALHRDATTKRIAAAIEIAQARRWHIDIQAPPDVIAVVAPQLASSPAPLVFDYFGWLAGGLEQPGFDSVASLVKSGCAYVKLAEPYRLSKRAPDYEDSQARGDGARRGQSRPRPVGFGLAACEFGLRLRPCANRYLARPAGRRRTSPQLARRLGPGRLDASKGLGRQPRAPLRLLA